MLALFSFFGARPSTRTLSRAQTIQSVRSFSGHLRSIPRILLENVNASLNQSRRDLQFTYPDKE